jgi:3-isopropylmalate/(R)-2-methylmalate dehydratase large subunit
VVELAAAEVPPTVTWGINPGQAISIDERVPSIETSAAEEHASIAEALEYMKLEPGRPIKGTRVDVTFIGSCTNARLSDFREVARFVRGRRVAPGVKALVVPGSQQVDREARAEGLDEIFRQAGFEWREAGCSMCVGMNGETAREGERVASTSNRNFEGRQGKGARTHLMSPAMAAAAAVTGRVTDVRALLA